MSSKSSRGTTFARCLLCSSGFLVVASCHVEVGVAIGGVASGSRNCFFKVGNYATGIHLLGGTM